MGRFEVARQRHIEALRRRVTLDASRGLRIPGGLDSAAVGYWSSWPVLPGKGATGDGQPTLVRVLFLVPVLLARPPARPARAAPAHLALLATTPSRSVRSTSTRAWCWRRFTVRRSKRAATVCDGLTSWAPASSSGRPSRLDWSTWCRSTLVGAPVLELGSTAGTADVPRPVTNCAGLSRLGVSSPWTRPLGRTPTPLSSPGRRPSGSGCEPSATWAGATKTHLRGPPECPSRPLCLLGLQRVYGLRFKDLVRLDTGGPVTRQALEDGNVDLALLFTTDPAIGGPWSIWPTIGVCNRPKT